MYDNKELMGLALAEARINLKTLDGGPFGAVVARDGELISAARNTVLKSDASSHAEINAIRKASAALGTYDLSSCVIFSTTEPCPMCFSAVHWAGIGDLYFGTAIEDVAALGFNELNISNQTLAKIGKSPVRIHPSFQREQCMRLLVDWSELPDKPVY